ncbi:unnamed protein product [Paramecium sonneborni]|uniref:Uncharacterized protein n=1 Tax=Paramecium sonneborni TaxID=65129 RepID=A0A8S1M503_9CILI|nr:unnamed protein product [Paramecium sonneborni]
MAILEIRIGNRNSQHVYYNTMIQLKQQITSEMERQQEQRKQIVFRNLYKTDFIISNKLKIQDGKDHVFKIKKLENGMRFGRVKIQILADYMILLGKRWVLGLKYLKIIGSNLFQFRNLSLAEITYQGEYLEGKRVGYWKTIYQNKIMQKSIQFIFQEEADNTTKKGNVQENGLNYINIFLTNQKSFLLVNIKLDLEKDIGRSFKKIN